MKRSLWLFLLLSELHPDILLAATYVVKKNDTLSAIAKTVRKPIYGRQGSLQEILNLNQNISDPDYLLPGTLLEIPDAVTQTTAPEPEKQISAKSAISPVLPQEKVQVAVLVSPLVGFYRIDSQEKETGSKASTLSDLGYGAGLGWDYKLSEEVSFQLFTSITKYNFMVSQNKKLTTPSLTRGEVGLGLNYMLNTRSKIGTQFTYGQEFILIAKNFSEVAIEKLQLAKVQGTYDYLLVSQDKLNILLGAMVGGLLPSETQEFQTELGFTYGLSSTFVYRLPFGRIENSLSYRHLKLETQSVKEKIQDTSLRTSFVLDI